MRLSLQSVRAMRPTSAIDLDRQELAVGHLHAALWPEVTAPPAPEVGPPPLPEAGARPSPRTRARGGGTP